ncbi:RNA 2',3'-cyclic phosphodiesterase [Clostridium grantii]|uniref:RNA 2',3'-cyclic phosphodiesterase n=1 Tax=Clostridium grantii DSM 8605 TaxID=1121316 RepID=A0A1M5WW45_9CLOT|nr:RNA 2',3'-cyclic phosphodiesterase [Clostridium grantii]SHH91915.1 2'-5' RNA ligase [Clostridium grantii DSM 8605]
MRVFISIELSKKIKKYLYEIQVGIHDNVEKGNFSDIENFHITLKYIGEQTQDEVLSLKKAIKKTATKLVPFKIQTDTLGFFLRGNKKIIWMGLTEKECLLDELFMNLEEELEKIGIKKEVRSFTPHITLLRDAILKGNFNILQNNINSKENINVEAISLMESIKINGKLTYIPIYECRLI